MLYSSIYQPSVNICLLCDDKCYQIKAMSLSMVSTSLPTYSKTLDGCVQKTLLISTFYHLNQDVLNILMLAV